MAVILLSAITANLSFLVAESALFQPLRDRAGRAAYRGSTTGYWLHKGMGCGYCAGHWIALALVLLTGTRLYAGWLGLPLTVLLVAWLSGWQWAMFSWIIGKLLER